MKVAIIGVGNMGGAVCEGLFNTGMNATYEITASDASLEKLEQLKAKYPQLAITTNNREAAKGADVVIVAVKPWLVKPVVEELQMVNKLRSRRWGNYPGTSRKVLNCDHGFPHKEEKNYNG